jgi:hypothetical protein
MACDAVAIVVRTAPLVGSDSASFATYIASERSAVLSSTLAGHERTIIEDALRART